MSKQQCAEAFARYFEKIQRGSRSPAGIIAADPFHDRSRNIGFGQGGMDIDPVEAHVKPTTEAVSGASGMKK